jgi:hypothetical protein
MKVALTLAAALACGAAFAQAPVGTIERPPAELHPAQSGGEAQATGEMRADMRMMMDANQDGMISRSEWDGYHTRMWSSMRADPTGNVAWAEVNTRMMGNVQGGPVGVGGTVGAKGNATPK